MANVGASRGQMKILGNRNYREAPAPEFGRYQKRGPRETPGARDQQSEEAEA